MAVFNKLLPRLSKPRGVSRKRQGGFVRLSMRLARWGGKKFSLRDLFAKGEPGAHFETYDPTSILARRNQLTFTDFPKGTANLSSSTSLVTSSALAGYDGAIAIGWDGATTVEGVKLLTGLAGATATFSAIVKMDDGGAPSFGSSAPAAAANDFCMNLGTSITVPPNSFTVQNLGDGTYRVSGTGVVGSGGNFGIRKHGANSNRTFVTTAWQVDVGASVTAYQKLTDWYTEYFAAGGDRITMFQDNLGVQPVTSVEQTIGLILDRSQGLVRGAEMLSPDARGGPFTTAAGWNAVDANTLVGLSGGNLTVTNNAAAIKRAYVQLATVVGRWYCFTAYLADFGGGNTGGRLCAGTTPTNEGFGAASRTSPGSVQLIFQATQATTYIQFSSNSSTLGAYTSWSRASIKTLAGNHATQSTSGFRPKLEARVNLITKTEQLTDAAWTVNLVTVGAGMVDPKGGTAAFRITATGASASLYQRITTSNAATLVRSVWIRRVSGVGTVRLYNCDGTTFTDITAALTGNWQLFTTTPVSVPAAASAYCHTAFLATSGDVVEIAFPDMRTTADAALDIPAYQRVNTASDYDTVGFPHRVRHDGSDDYLSVPLNMSATDKVTVWMSGNLKTSDAASQMLVELTTSSSGTAGGFALVGPYAAAAANYASRSRGSVLPADAITGTTFPAPSNVLLTLSGDIANDVDTLDANGAQAASAAGDQGTGTYANDTLYIGRRAGSTLPSNCGWSALTVRGAASSTSHKNAMNRYHARLAKIKL